MCACAPMCQLHHHLHRQRKEAIENGSRILFAVRVGTTEGCSTGTCAEAAVLIIRAWSSWGHATDFLVFGAPYRSPVVRATRLVFARCPQLDASDRKDGCCCFGSSHQLLCLVHTIVPFQCRPSVRQDGRRINDSTSGAQAGSEKQASDCQA